MMTPQQDAIDWSLHCFKSQAMTKTHDQLKQEVDDIISGLAVFNRSYRRIEYNGDKDAKQPKCSEREKEMV